MAVKGLKGVLGSLKKFGEESKKSVEIITFANAKDIELSAKSLAPKNVGKLAQSIHTKEVNKTFYKIVVGLDYGAYVEFGTGAKVRVPTELKDQAAKFRGGRGGSFKDGLRSIKDWCRTKGIDESAAYPIFISILRNGITPQPYLYPSWKAGQKEYLKDLKKELKLLTKKYN